MHTPEDSLRSTRATLGRILVLGSASLLMIGIWYGCALGLWGQGTVIAVTVGAGVITLRGVPLLAPSPGGARSATLSQCASIVSAIGLATPAVILLRLVHVEIGTDVLLAILGTASAGAMLVAGLRARAGDEPSCAGCAYPMPTEHPPERCPECGRQWLEPGGVAFGRIVRTRSLIAVGATALALVAGVLGAAVSGVRGDVLYRVLPTDVLVDRSFNADPRIGNRAIVEIRRRALSPQQSERLAARILHERWAGTARPATERWLVDQLLLDQLPDAIVDRHHDTLIRLSIDGPQAASVGEPVVLSIAAQQTQVLGPSYVAVFLVGFRAESGWLDDGPRRLKRQLSERRPTWAEIDPPGARPVRHRSAGRPRDARGRGGARAGRPAGPAHRLRRVLDRGPRAAAREPPGVASPAGAPTPRARRAGRLTGPTRSGPAARRRGIRARAPGLPVRSTAWRAAARRTAPRHAATWRDTLMATTHAARRVALALTTLTGLAGAAPVAAPQRADAQPAQAREPDRAEPAVLFSSTLWHKAKYDVAGSFRIERADDGLVLVLGSDFKTKDGPDLKVVLSPHQADKATGRNALRGGLNLGLLKRIKGESRYRIPEGTDLKRFQSVLIHCEEYSVLWGGAPMTQGRVVAHGDKWTKKTNRITGAWEIAETERGRVIRFRDDFKTRKAPDLKIVLSPLTVAQTSSRNALQGAAIVALLESHRGAQEFRIPDGVDLGDYRSLLIHCEQYTKLWGAAPLGAG